MNRECRRRRTGLINVQKRYLFRGTRKGARAVLTAGCGDQASLGEFRERFPHESGVGIHARSECGRTYFPAAKKTKNCHDMGGNRELNVRDGHRISPRKMCDVYQHNVGASFFKRPEVVAGFET